MATSFEFNPFTGTFDIVTDAPDLTIYAEATPTHLRAGKTWTVRADKQALFCQPIQVDGIIHNDGTIMSVS